MLRDDSGFVHLSSLKSDFQILSLFLRFCDCPRPAERENAAERVLPEQRLS